ncbi:MAG: hypothetical protein V4694_05255 [Pseudomonadota bacterium]
MYIRIYRKILPALSAICFLLLASACTRTVEVSHINPIQNQQQYYRPQQQYQPPQYAPPQYQQPSPYYYQQQPTYYQPYQQVTPGSRFYSNPYAIPPSTQSQYYDSDQYYVPPTSSNNIERAPVMGSGTNGPF